MHVARSSTCFVWQNPIPQFCRCVRRVGRSQEWQKPALSFCERSGPSLSTLRETVNTSLPVEHIACPSPEGACTGLVGSQNPHSHRQLRNGHKVFCALGVTEQRLGFCWEVKGLGPVAAVAKRRGHKATTARVVGRLNLEAKPPRTVRPAASHSGRLNEGPLPSLHPM